MRARLADEGLDRQVILHVTRLIDEAVLPVRRKRIESHVGDDSKAWKLLLYGPHGRLRNTIGIP